MIVLSGTNDKVLVLSLRGLIDFKDKILSEDSVRAHRTVLGDPGTGKRRGPENLDSRATIELGRGFLEMKWVLDSGISVIFKYVKCVAMAGEFEGLTKRTSHVDRDGRTGNKIKINVIKNKIHHGEHR